MDTSIGFGVIFEVGCSWKIHTGEQVGATFKSDLTRIVECPTTITDSGECGESGQI